MNDLEHFTRDAEAQIIAANKRAEDIQAALTLAQARADEADKRAARAMAERDVLRLENHQLRMDVAKLRGCVESAQAGTHTQPPDYAAGKAC